MYEIEGETIDMISKKLENIKNNVCEFYINHKGECDNQYLVAEWKNFGEIYENISEQKIIKSLFTQTAIVILTANKYEKNILHGQISSLNKCKIKRFEIQLFPNKEFKAETYAYSFEWQGYVILHIEAQQTGSYTYGGSADIIRYILNSKSIYPMAIMSYGICFGTNEINNSLGDVLISKKIYPYFMGAKITDTGYFVTDDNMFKINSSLAATIKSMLDENAFSLPANKVYFGNYITGEAVVSRKKARDEFVKVIREPVIGGEMEGYGLFKECNGFSHAIPCLIVKSICDWAVLKNFDTRPIFEKMGANISEEEQKTIKERIQAYSAYQAYCVVNIMLEKHLFNDSVYKTIRDYIVKRSGKVLLAQVIKEQIQNIGKECLSTQVDDSFILDSISNLQMEGLFEQDSPEDRINSDNIWSQSFLIRKR